jgi:hypothetical protein
VRVRAGGGAHLGGSARRERNDDFVGRPRQPAEDEETPEFIIPDPRVGTLWEGKGAAENDTYLI